MEKLTSSFFDILNSNLNSQLISGRVLLDSFRLIDENSRKTAAYLDHKYIPFYYHLGKYIKPKNFIEIGFNLGLISGGFLTSCKSVETFFGYKANSPDFPSIRIGKSNIKLKFKGNSFYYVGNTYDKEFVDIFSKKTWDLAVINEEVSYDQHLHYLETIWSNLSENGIIISEYVQKHEPAKEAFSAFYESKNRTPIIFKTRYGTGLIQK